MKKGSFKRKHKKGVSNRKVACKECGVVISRKGKVALAHQLCGGVVCGGGSSSRKTGGTYPTPYTSATIIQGGLPGHGKRR